MGCIYFETVLNDFVSKKSSDAKYFFFSCPKYNDQELIVIIVYYFQIWNKKEHNIIINRVISNHISPIETCFI